MTGVLRFRKQHTGSLAGILTVFAYGMIAQCLAFVPSIAGVYQAIAPEGFIPVNPTALEDTCTGH